eukprot:3864150-Pyramimonas_sp.AAC.1
MREDGGSRINLACHHHTTPPRLARAPTFSDAPGKTRLSLAKASDMTPCLICRVKALALTPRDVLDSAVWYQVGHQGVSGRGPF